MEALISCPSCGVAMNLDAVQPNPGKKCPVCNYPLNETALEEHTNQDAQNPANGPRDAARKAVRDQLAADVAGVQSAHAAAKADVAAAAPGAMSSLSSRVASLESRTLSLEATAAKPAVTPTVP